MKVICGSKPSSLIESYEEILNYLKENPCQSDIYGRGDFVNNFEKEVAEKAGVESGLFLPSGVMAQLIAIRIYADRFANNTFACHETCHLNLHEENAYRELHNLTMIVFGEKTKVPLVSDIKALKKRPSSIVYELPFRHLGGDLPSLKELQEIKDYCLSQKIKLHIDGARIFETLPYYNVELKELMTDVDSLFISFYKGFGSTSGSMLLGDNDFIKEARKWLRRHGGNLYQLHSLYLPAKINYDKRKNSFQEYVKKNKSVIQAIKNLTNIEIQPISPETNMFHALIPIKRNDLLAKLKNERFRALNLGVWAEESDGRTRIEFTTGDSTLAWEDDEISTLLKELLG